MATASPLLPPERLIGQLPVRGTPLADAVAHARQRIRRILHGQDERLLVVVGPWPMDEPSACEGLRHLCAQRERHAATLEIVLRAEPGSPCATAPGQVAGGLRAARERLLSVLQLGLPVATGWRDPLLPRYLGDLVCWAAVEAHSIESQVHRELASSLPTPVGFELGAGARIGIGLDALRTAARPHRFLGVDGGGQVAMLRSRGNPDTHLVVGPGGQTGWSGACEGACEGTCEGTCEGPSGWADVCAGLARAGLAVPVLADCRHARPAREHGLARDIAMRVAAGARQVVGLALADPSGLLDLLAQAVRCRRRRVCPGRNSRDTTGRHTVVVTELG